MIYELQTQTLTTNAFRAFGEVIDATGEPDKIINQGLCGRYHDLAKLDLFGKLLNLLILLILEAELC